MIVRQGSMHIFEKGDAVRLLSCEDRFNFYLMFANGGYSLENIKVSEEKWKVRIIE